MVRTIGVRFKKAGKIYYFDPVDYDIKVGDGVIVETVRGIEYGVAVLGIRDVPEEDIVAPLKMVIRVASPEDKKLYETNKIRGKEAFTICLSKIKQHKLNMKMVDVEYTFDNNKIIFYFTADGRIDFRDLVKDLASVFRTRIELRQIGVRDEAKILNGIGPCGRTLCCSTHLSDFTPVSIKMAKEQGLSLNPVKISGICGRLMCCLKYEQDQYECTRKKLPRPGALVETPDGKAEVLDVNVLKESVKVRLEVPDENSKTYKEFKADTVEVLRQGKEPEQDLSAHKNIKELKSLEDN